MALIPSIALPQISASKTLLFGGGTVLTADGPVEATVVRDGIVIGVGTHQEMQRLAGPGAVRIDVRGGAVLPGFVDSHVHPLFAGLEQFQCRLDPGAGAAAVRAAVAACAAAARPGDWIRGGNWVAASFASGEQTRALLDEAAPDHPVMLADEAHHSLWVNSRALALAGVTRQTPDPPNGIIERAASGEPTGLLRETATRLVERVVPPDDLERRRAAMLLSTRQMLSYGITSFTVASVRDEDIEPLSQLSREGLLKQRVRGCIVWEHGPGAEHARGERLIAERARFANGNFRLDCVKLFLDGVPTESRTAAMLQPYVGPHGQEGGKAADGGRLHIPQAQLNEAVTRFDRLGLSVKFHAAGDAAVRAAVIAVESAHLRNGDGGPLHAVGHASFVDPADIARGARTRIAWEFSPYIWQPTPIGSIDIAGAVGTARMRRWIPIRDAVCSGTLVVAGSDWSVVPSVNPWPALETMVTRHLPGGGGQPLGPGQTIPLAEALKLFTVGGARLMGRSDESGTIAPGMRADLIVTDADPFRIPIDRVHAITVRMTFIDGELVYDAAGQSTARHGREP